MSLDLDRTLSFAALIAATFVFVASAYAQQGAGNKPPAAASAAQAEHKGMHKMTAKEREQHRKEMHDKMHGDKADGGKDDKDCMGMMDKHKKQGNAKDGAGHADHAGSVKTAAADKSCDMGNKH